MGIAFLCMCFVATFVNFYVSRFESKKNDLSKNIKTFKVSIFDEGVNAYANLFNKTFKKCVEDYLSKKYKLTKNDINQDLLLEYVVESYSVEPIQDNEKEKNVKFKFSLKYTVLGKEELIRSKEIEFKIDASHENDTNYNIKIIVEKQVDDLVSSILENNFLES